ncbi:LmeA family phospholipid-binding protein [Vacuolonema iberomarrocanum]|uniref:LmeA family phospholipid-binding protein n=1 Tax=Vacuolonema iberomarrocanum TaxID=3454632 RepID=UPI001A0DC6C6|nr:DUF2993 domain-containing protein [filamentous cyanobacterium LEGE 07170]
MFSLFTSSKSSTGTDFGEQLINKVATQSIRHLFSQSEAVDVQIRCHPPSKLLQGSIDSFQMSGRNLLIRREFHVEDMSFVADAVAIDPSSLLSGKVRLKQPTQAVAQVVLTEKGINRAFKAELVQKRLVNVESEALMNFSGGEPITFRDVEVELLPENQIQINALTDLPNRQDVPIRMTATIIVERRRRIRFDNPTFNADGVDDDVRGVSEIFTNAFADVLNEMVDLDRFDLDGVTLRLNRLETSGKNLVFSGYAQIDHFPGT